MKRIIAGAILGVAIAATLIACGSQSEAERYCAKQPKNEYFGRQQCLRAYKLGQQWANNAQAYPP